VDYTVLGRTGLRVSALCLGSAWPVSLPSGQTRASWSGRRSTPGSISLTPRARTAARPASTGAAHRRLETSYLDLYYAYHPDPATGTDDLVETFDRLIDRGLIRHWALSNFAAWQSVDVYLTARPRGCVPPAAQQVYYNLARRSAERELLPALGWLLSRPGVAATVVGPESVQELATLAAGLSRPLPAELVSAVDALTEPGADQR
jgi:aryl-alcohol dehydrogenase-like predicted oxidoreductase